MRSLLAATALFGLMTAPLAAQTSPETGAAMPDPEQVVARVNGNEITWSDLEAARDSLPPEYQQVPIEQLYEPLLERVIDAELLLVEARERDYANDPAVQERLARAEEGVLREALVRDQLEQATSDEALRAAYEQRSQSPEFERQEVKARHILLEDQETANAVIEELEGGGDFASLAQERSTGPSASDGGDLGWFARDAMVAPFAEAAFALEPGSYTSEPVETQFGWHVIMVEETRTAAPSFEEVAPELRQTAEQAALQNIITTAREGAEVERFAMDGSPIEDNFGLEDPAATEEPAAMEEEPASGADVEVPQE